MVLHCKVILHPVLSLLILALTFHTQPGKTYRNFFYFISTNNLHSWHSIHTFLMAHGKRNRSNSRNTTICKRVTEWCFRPQFCTVNAILGLGQPGRMRWILVWTIPLVQDRSLDLLTSNPLRYHCATVAPKIWNEKLSQGIIISD